MRCHGTAGPGSSDGDLRTQRGMFEFLLQYTHLHFPLKYANLLDGVMLDHVGSSAGLVVMEGGCTSLSLL